MFMILQRRTGTRKKKTDQSNTPAASQPIRSISTNLAATSSSQSEKWKSPEGWDSADDWQTKCYLSHTHISGSQLFILKIQNCLIETLNDSWVKCCTGRVIKHLVMWGMTPVHYINIWYIDYRLLKTVHLTKYRKKQTNDVKIKVEFCSCIVETLQQSAFHQLQEFRRHTKPDMFCEKLRKHCYYDSLIRFIVLQCSWEPLDLHIVR